MELLERGLLAAILITEVEGETILVCQAPGCDWPGTVEPGDKIAVIALSHKQYHVQQERICQRQGHEEVGGVCLRCCVQLSEPPSTLHPAVLVQESAPATALV